MTLYISARNHGGGWTLQFSVVWEDLSQSNEWVREAKSSILKMPRLANPARITEHVCVRTEMTCHTLDLNIEISYYHYLLHNDTY